MYINVSREAAAWLGLVNHDLVKRLLWPARDRRALGGPVQPGELVVVLADGDGSPHSAEQTWQALRAEAPAFGPAIAARAGGVRRGGVRGSAGGRPRTIWMACWRWKRRSTPWPGK